MQLSDDQIEDFVRCWKSDFGEVLASEMARAEAMRLLDVFAELVDVIASAEATVEERKDGRSRTI